jgi:hypothetical protein
MNYPAQGYPAPQPQQGYPQQYPQQPVVPSYPGQQTIQQPYPQQYGAPMQPQVPQGPPPAQGSIDDFYDQPSGSFGNALSWKDKPIGTSYAGIVARKITNADIIQDSDPQTGALKTYRDGRPKFVMKVPLRVQPTQEFPDGEMTWFVRGQARDELTRAMGEAGVGGAPQEGAAMSITLVERKPQRQGNPANIVRVQYQPPAGGQQEIRGVDGAASQGGGEVQQAPAPQPQPTPQVAYQTQEFGSQQQAPQMQMPQPQVPQGPPPVQQFQAPQAPVQQQAPAPQPQGGPQPPSDLDAEQQALLARLTQPQG